MREKNVKKLLSKVVQDYNSISDQFDLSRQHKWKEFEIFEKYVQEGQKILDLGCGNGRFYKHISHRNIDYLGIDNSEKLLEAAKNNNPEAKFKLGDLTTFEAENIDLILAIASFHHLPSKQLREQSLKKIHKALKKNGIFIITVWNLFQPKYKKYIWLARLNWLFSFGKYDMHDTFIPWADTGINRYYHAFTPKSLKNLLTNNKFEIIEEEVGNNIIFICRKKS